MDQARAQRRSTPDVETEPSRPLLRRVRTAPVPIVFDPVEEVAARALASSSTATRTRGPATPAPARREPEQSSTAAEATPRRRARNHLIAIPPTASRAATTRSAPVAGTPAIEAAPPARSTRTRTTVTPTDSDPRRPAEGRNEWDMLEEIILMERLRVLSERMAREVRAG